MKQEKSEQSPATTYFRSFDALHNTIWCEAAEGEDVFRM